MLRGVFMPPGATPEQVAFYVGLLRQVARPPEWKEFMEKGAFKQTSLTGAAFTEWLGKNEQMHQHADEGSGLPGAVMQLRRKRRACRPGEGRDPCLAVRPDCGVSRMTAGAAIERQPSVSSLARAAVAALLVAVALLVIADSLRVGIGWADDGPRSGYFPFYIGLLLLASSGSVLISTQLRWRGRRSGRSPSASS